MTKLTVLFFFSVITGGLYAQESTMDSSSLRATTYTRKLYDAKRNNELPLYNGLRHQLYPASIDGIPYYESLDWYKGSVVYDNVLYENVTLRFDQVKEQLVITHDASTGVFIGLFTPRVKEFTLPGARFFRVTPDSARKSSIPAGFYQELVKGKLTALARNVKDIVEKLEGTHLFYLVENHEKYYVLKDGIYHPVKNQNDLLDLVKDHKKEVQQYLSRSQLKYRREPKQTLIAVIQFYNQL